MLSALGSLTYARSFGQIKDPQDAYIVMDTIQGKCASRYFADITGASVGIGDQYGSFFTAHDQVGDIHISDRAQLSLSGYIPQQVGAAVCGTL